MSATPSQTVTLEQLVAVRQHKATQTATARRESARRRAVLVRELARLRQTHHRVSVYTAADGITPAAAEVQ